MIQKLREFQKGHLSPSLSELVLIDFPCPGLPEGMRGEITDGELVADLVPFELSVNHLTGDDTSVAVQEAVLRGVLHPEDLVTPPDMSLERMVDEDDPPLSGLLLPKGQVLLPQDILPGESKKVRYAEPEEAPAAHQEAHAVLPVLVQPPDQLHRPAPGKVVRPRARMECAHTTRPPFLKNAAISSSGIWTPHFSENSVFVLPQGLRALL